MKELRESFMDEEVALIQKSMKVNKILRERYTNIFCRDEIMPCSPFGGDPRESIGPWPEIIYKGFRCPRSSLGLCSPCGYSNIEKVPKDQFLVNRSILFQTKYVLEFFDYIVSKNQRRKSPYHFLSKKYSTGKDILIGIATTGSFFCNDELNEETRIEILEMILRYVREKEINIQIFFESHAMDVINIYERTNFERISSILQELNAVIIVGLESVNDFNRNVLYCKDLNINDFEKAVSIIKNDFCLHAGAFVFAGLHAMNDYETLNDVEKTLSYLKEKQIMPVMMIANSKPFTLHHLLYEYELYHHVDPRTVLSICETLKDLTPSVDTTENWLLADPMQGPPQPIVNSFNDRNRITCDKCSKVIWEIICGSNGLRETYDWEAFLDKKNEVVDCSCAQKYREFMKKCKDDSENVDVIERAKRNVNLAFEKSLEYTKKWKETLKFHI